MPSFIQNKLLSLRESLSQQVDNGSLEAELLLSHCLNLSKEKLLTCDITELSSDQNLKLNLLLNRRLAGEPLAYILGHKEFWSLDFCVTPDVLIPRPETELLVECCLNQFNLDPAKILELGTGSGAIAITLAHERPSWKITATDQSPAALTIAQSNATRHNISNITWLLGDWFSPIQEKFDAIISNPPYIAPNDTHLSALRYEPVSALIAEENGLKALAIIISQAKNYLMPKGILMLEHGYDQAQTVAAMLTDHGYAGIKCYKDFAENPRVSIAFMA